MHIKKTPTGLSAAQCALIWSDCVDAREALLLLESYIWCSIYLNSKSKWQFSLWSTMLVMFLVEVLLPIPFSFAIASSMLIGIFYLIIETSLYFGKSLFLLDYAAFFYSRQPNLKLVCLKGQTEENLDTDQSLTYVAIRILLITVLRTRI